MNGGKQKIQAMIINGKGQVVHKETISTNWGDVADQGRKKSYQGQKTPTAGVPDLKGVRGPIRVWNDPDADAGEYSLKLKLLEGDVFLLSHIYWTVDDESMEEEE